MTIPAESIPLLIISFLLGLILKDYLPSYMKKKAENLARKEDIELITEKVESVKMSIEIDKQVTMNLLTQKQQMLMNFYDEITAFHYELLSVNFGDLPYDNGKSLYEYQTRFYTTIAEISKSYQRLVIFLPPESSLILQANSLTESVIESRKIVKKHFGKIKSTVINEQQALESGDKELYKASALEADAVNNLFWQEMKPSVECFQKNFREFLTELNGFYSLEPKSA